MLLINYKKYFAFLIFFLFFVLSQNVLAECNFQVYAGGKGPYSLNKGIPDVWKFWTSVLESNPQFYKVETNANSTQLIKGNETVYNISISNNFFCFPDKNKTYDSGSKYKFRNGASCESKEFYIGPFPNLKVEVSPRPMYIGQPAEVTWEITGGITGLTNGGWLGNIRLQWYQDDKPLNNLTDGEPVENKKYDFDVPSELYNTTIPGKNFRIAGVNADEGTSIPAGFVYDFSEYFEIKEGQPDLAIISIDYGPKPANQGKICGFIINIKNQGTKKSELERCYGILRES